MQVPRFEPWGFLHLLLPNPPERNAFYEPSRIPIITALKSNQLAPYRIYHPRRLLSTLVFAGAVIFEATVACPMGY